MPDTISFRINILRYMTICAPKVLYYLFLVNMANSLLWAMQQNKLWYLNYFVHAGMGNKKNLCFLSCDSCSCVTEYSEVTCILLNLCPTHLSYTSQSTAVRPTSRIHLSQLMPSQPLASISVNCCPAHLSYTSQSTAVRPTSRIHLSQLLSSPPLVYISVNLCPANLSYMYISINICPADLSYTCQSTDAQPTSRIHLSQLMPSPPLVYISITPILMVVSQLLIKGSCSMHSL